MRIIETTLLTADLLASHDFFTSQLGLELLSRDKSNIRFKAGRSELHFTVSPIPGPYYHLAFEIPNNKLSEVTAWLGNKVAWITQPDGGLIADFKNWNAQSIYCFDNNGNILEFISRFDNPTASHHPLKGNQLICISEIGLVSPDLKTLSWDIISQTGSTYYTKQPPTADFTALGDDEGLLILSSDKRNWFPTNIPAKSFPGSTTIETGNKIATLQFL